MSISNTYIGIFAALVSTMSWAICSLIFKKLGERLEPIGMATIKTSLSFIILLFIILLSSTDLILSSKDILMIALSGILGIAIGDSLFFAALNKLSPFVLSIILFVGPDLFSGIFGLFFLKEIPSLLSWFGIFFILLGLAFLIFPVENKKNFGKSQILGILFALLSLICTAYSMVLIKPILLTSSAITVTMYRMFFAASILLVYAVLSGKIFLWKIILSDKIYFAKLSGTISLVTIGGFWLSLIAIKFLKLIVASTLMLLEPLFILIFMIIFCKYQPNKKDIFCIITIFTGIILLCFN